MVVWLRRLFGGGCRARLCYGEVCLTSAHLLTAASLFYGAPVLGDPHAEGVVESDHAGAVSLVECGAVLPSDLNSQQIWELEPNQSEYSSCCLVRFFTALERGGDFDNLVC